MREGKLQKWKLCLQVLGESGGWRGYSSTCHGGQDRLIIHRVTVSLWGNNTADTDHSRLDCSTPQECSGATSTSTTSTSTTSSTVVECITVLVRVQQWPGSPAITFLSGHVCSHHNAGICNQISTKTMYTHYCPQPAPANKIKKYKKTSRRKIIEVILKQDLLLKS